MRRIAGACAGVFAVMLALPAQAQDEGCTSDYPLNDFIHTLNSVDTKIAAFDVEGARVELGVAQLRLTCTSEPVHPNLLARFAREQAYTAFLDQDEDMMLRWQSLALGGEAPWVVDEEHPFRSTLNDTEKAPLGGPEGAFLNVPKGGGILLNGRLIDKPLAPIDGPNFVQVFDKSGQRLDAYWQEGGVFPMNYLRADEIASVTPTWYTAPDPAMDPTKDIVLSAEEIARRAAVVAAAEAERKAEAERQVALQAAAAKKSEAEAKKAEKARAKSAAVEAKKKAKEDKDRVVVAAVVAPTLVVPSEWETISFDEEKAALSTTDTLESAAADDTCADLVTLEPKALLGKLAAADVTCLEKRLRLDTKQTDRDKISRVLMADAWTKNEPGRWEAAVRRHLTEIDRSDAELCYIFSRYLAQQGPSRAGEAIRWADTAMQNSGRTWEGAQFVKRMSELHRIKALAAQQRWYQTEADFIDAGSARELLDTATEWRNTTKVAAREWLQFTKAAGIDSTMPYEVCLSAAGTRDYCEVD